MVNAKQALTDARETRGALFEKIDEELGIADRPCLSVLTTVDIVKAMLAE